MAETTPDTAGTGAPSAPWLDLRLGDALTVLATLPEQSVNCCVTSPPYWGLRDYGVDGQLGLEMTPDDYIDKAVDIFREVGRVLRDDGTLWLNMGDAYAASAGTDRKPTTLAGPEVPSGWSNRSQPLRWSGRSEIVPGKRIPRGAGRWGGGNLTVPFLKAKDLIGLPWMLAFALRADGWYLRSDIIWSKPNPMPESVKDRPTKAHEYLFLLSKSERYFYDFEAVCEPVAAKTYTTYGIPSKGYGDGTGLVKSENWARDVAIRKPRTNGKHATTDEQAPGHRMVEGVAAARAAGGDHDNPFGYTRNRRTVWTVDTQPYPGAHFATFPADLIKPCILAGSPEGGTVLDPFVGSGTTAEVANRLGRRAIGIELNPLYLELAQKRCNQVTVWEAVTRE